MFVRHYCFIIFLSISWLLQASDAFLGAEEWKSGITWKIPRTVEPGPRGRPPQDAIVLFDGKDMGAFEGGENWQLREGYVVADKNGIASRQAFGDCQLHLEFASPPEDKGTGQGKGNSGLYLMGRYEVQILDSYENETYPDGQAAAIYKQSPHWSTQAVLPVHGRTWIFFFVRHDFQIPEHFCDLQQSRSWKFLGTWKKYVNSAIVRIRMGRGTGRMRRFQ